MENTKPQLKKLSLSSILVITGVVMGLMAVLIFGTASGNSDLTPEQKFFELNGQVKEKQLQWQKLEDQQQILHNEANTLRDEMNIISDQLGLVDFN